MLYEPLRVWVFVIQQLKMGIRGKSFKEPSKNQAFDKLQQYCHAYYDPGIGLVALRIEEKVILPF